VVDDQSEDRTATIAETFGSRTIRSLALPLGWAGKPWACMQGARAAKGDLLLFLDADTVMARGGLARLLASFPESRGVLSVQPYHLMKRAYERLSAVFNIIVLAGSDAFTPLGSKRKPMGAFGPCLLCSREDYFLVGGHERVRGEILENVALGKVFLNAGFRVCCYGGKGVLSFRMYGDGFRSMVEGFTKGFGKGAGSISWINLLMIVCWIFGSVSLTRHSDSVRLPGGWGPLGRVDGTLSSLCHAVLLDALSHRQFWLLARPPVSGSGHLLCPGFLSLPLQNRLSEKGPLERAFRQHRRGKHFGPMRLIHFPTFWTVVLNIIAWLIIHLAVVAFMVRIPNPLSTRTVLSTDPVFGKRGDGSMNGGCASVGGRGTFRMERSSPRGEDFRKRCFRRGMRGT
jgi:hypothetical protein